MFFRSRPPLPRPLVAAYAGHRGAGATTGADISVAVAPALRAPSRWRVAAEGPARSTEGDGSNAGPRRVDPLLAEWFRDHAGMVWRVVARLGVPAHSVEDVVQEAFITASRRRADIGPGQARGFLLSTAIRLCSNYRRRGHVRKELSHAGLEQQRSPHPDAEQLLIEKGLRELLERVLAQMSARHREVFVLYELEGLSVPAIAELLAVPLGTVSSRLTRARARFSELGASFEQSSPARDGTLPARELSAKKESP